jgi:tRNA modification GTPase
VFASDDTIVAIATPQGRGGIGVVRLSGPASHEIARTILDRGEPLQPRHATLARVRGVDEVIATYFAAPHSYTTEHVVEIAAHGSPVVLRAIVDAAMSAGARLAEPGEFTLRAFLNGRIDLVQSEAVADLIDAATPLQARTAFDQLEGTLTRRIREIDAALFDLVARLEASLDFPDEGYHFITPPQIRAGVETVIDGIDRLLADARRGRTVREGAQVALVGPPNAGKSSLFNYLAGHDRAIVTAVPGTTRDLVTETIDLCGIPITLIDTAGLRETSDVVEREGVDRARQAADVASVTVLVMDGSMPLQDDEKGLLAASWGRQRWVIVRNKCDLPARWDCATHDGRAVAVSAVTGQNLDELRRAILERLEGGEERRDAPTITNARHIALLARARTHLRSAADAAAEGVATPEEFLLAELQPARAAIEEVTGTRTSEDLLQHIFERFCIGK